MVQNQAENRYACVHGEIDVEVPQLIYVDLSMSVLGSRYRLVDPRSQSKGSAVQVGFPLKKSHRGM